MILVYQDLKCVINLGVSGWSLIECQEADRGEGEAAEKVPVVVFVFGGGVQKIIPFETTAARDEHFAGITERLQKIEALLFKKEMEREVSRHIEQSIIQTR